MEEKKCCENGICENCKDKKECCCCQCCDWLRKHPSVKKIIPIILIILAFCLGLALGDENDRRDYRKDYSKQTDCINFTGPAFRIRDDFKNLWQDEVTVKIQPEVETDKVVPPPAIQ